MTLTGQAIWHEGNLEDSGPITLIASADGTATATIQLASSGTRVESQGPIGATRSCTWSKGNGVANTVTSNNCWKPFVWFLPALTFQPTLAPVSLGISDLGASTLNGASVLQLQGGLVFPTFPVLFDQQLLPSTSAIVSFDPTTYRPLEMDYGVFPDDGRVVQVPIAIAYSNYSTSSGVTVPLSIQRYVNGTLQLDISVVVVSTN